MRAHRRLLLVAVAVLGLAACESAPPAPPAPPADTVWKVVGTWSGHGNAQLETFPIERFTWRVRWETKNESPAGTGTFQVTANSGDSGRILAEVVDATGVDKDVQYITELPHRYYLVVASTGVDWTLTAEEPVF